MSHSERLRDVVRFYTQEAETTSDGQMKKYYAERASEIAQMADVAERAEIKKIDGVA